MDGVAVFVCSGEQRIGYPPRGPSGSGLALQALVDRAQQWGVSETHPIADMHDLPVSLDTAFQVGHRLREVVPHLVYLQGTLRGEDEMTALHGQAESIGETPRMIP